VPSDGEYVNYPDRSYRYGSTQDGQREPHHGVELVNPRGTPILAAAPGTVIVAGNDDQVAYGPTTKFYGNLVVVQLDQASNGLPVYNLYGHMLEVAAKVGDRVDTGDLLGSVGLTGVAIGAHLHFEVRVGQNDYESTRNPELWFIPLPMKNKPQGVVAGRVVDTNDHLVPELTVVLRPLAVKADYVHNFYLTTYANDPYQLNGDAVLQENFAITDVPPGTYSVSVNTTKFYQQTITVKPGQIAWAAFVVKPLPPTETPTVAP
jgi:murein DD-endopeptidase MepM/ murein hydrolase activator NlpD